MKNKGKRNKEKIVRAEGFEVVDKCGRKGVLLAMSNGIPHLLFYDKNRKIRCWLTLDADGSPVLQSFGPDGKTPFFK